MIFLQNYIIILNIRKIDIKYLMEKDLFFINKLNIINVCLIN